MEDNQNFNLENSQEEATENLSSNGNGEQVAKPLEEEKEENPHFIIVLRRVFIVLTVLIFILNVALYIFFSSICYPTFTILIFIKTFIITSI